MLRNPVVAAALAGAALLLPAASAHAGQDNPWLSQRVLNFAHQGGEDEYPSNTMYAYRESLKHGAGLLEIDVGATKDGRLVVLHDNTVDRLTNGTGSITDMTLAEIQKLDGAYWYVPGRGTSHDAAASAYRFRGIRTGDRRPPRGYKAADFAIPSLDDVLRAFPRVAMNIEIKGRDGKDEAVYLRTAELLAKALKKTGRTDIIVASFEQPAIDRFHELAPRVPVSPGIDGAAKFVLQNGSPGPGVAAFQVPITFELGGQKLTITTPDFVKRAHEAGYAVHVWLSNDREDDATYRELIGMCVDGIMAAKPVRLTAVLRRLHTDRTDPCGTKVAAARITATRSSAVVRLARQGRSMERRSGAVRLYARRGGALLGTGRFILASDGTTTSTKVRLTARGRAAMRGGASVAARADVVERGRTVTTRRVVLKG